MMNIMFGQKKLLCLGYDSYDGRGCFAFTMIANEKFFGKIAVNEYKDKNKIKVGDILRLIKILILLLLRENLEKMLILILICLID